MTEEEVVNVGGEISEGGGAENGDDDQHKIKGEYCNDVAHAMENEQVVMNGDVGGKIDSDASDEFVGGSDAVAADGDSGASDLVAVVDDNVAGAGAASEGLDLEHKVDGDGEGLGESQVTVLEVVEAECECEVVIKENDCADASVVRNGSAEEEIRETEISNGSVSVDVDVGVENAVRESESECADGQNGSGSVTVLDVSGDEKDVTTTTVVEEGVTDVNKIHDLKIESVVVGAEDVQNGVADRELSECAVENEIHGDVNGISVTDVNKVHHHEFESVVGAADIQNGVENEIRDDVNGVQECENIAGSAEVLGDEKDVTTTTTVVEEGVTDVNKIHDHEIKSVVVGAEDVQNGMADRELSECAVENEIHGDVNGVSVTDVNKIHNHEFESVVGAADVQNGVEIEIRDDVNGGQEGENIAGAAEVLVDEKDVSTTIVVEEGVTDVNKIHDHEFESVVVGAEDVQNGVADREVSECAVENEIHGDVNGVSVTDVNEVHDHKFESVVGAADVQNGVANEIRDDVNGVQECENIAGAAEVLGDEKDVVTVVEGVADVNKSHGEFESVAVQNGVADTELSECTEKNEISVAVVDGVSEECVDKGAQNSSGDKAQIESVDSGGGDEKDGGTVVQERSESVSDTVVDIISLECENIVSAAASDEKDIVSKESHDGEFKSVVVADDQNGLADMELSECAEKNEISVDVDGVSADSDVKECADEDDHNGLEKAQIESVTDTDVDQSIVGADVQNGLADAEENEIPTEGEPGSKLEMSEEESGHELVPEGENLSALNSTDMTGDGNVVSDTKENAVEREGEPSADMSDMKNNGVESEAEPSNIAVESETEPSVEGELSVEVEGGKHGDGDSRAAQEGSTTDTLDGQNMGAEVVKRPFYYLIRFPRYDDDENIKEQIKNALHQVEEKTKIRDAIRVESQTKKASCKECGQDVRAAISAERAARDLLKSKRQEMDSVQSTMNRLNNAISVGDIDGKIRNMEHMIQHETLPLKEEKQLIRQIKQLKQNREELSSNMGKQDQSQQSLDHKDSVEEHFKRLQLLKKEVELLRNNVLKTEVATKAARKKYDDESNKLSELLARFKAADDIRQEAYAKLQALRKQLHEKSKYFWEYKNAAKKGQELAAEGKREELQCFCVEQVERIMELWNKNDEFRRDYVRCNTRSTLRRLQTVDGRSLGPDEEPPVIPNALTERAPKNNSLISQSTPEQEKKSTSTESVNIKDEPVSKVVVQRTDKSQTTKAKKPAKPAPLEKSLVAVSRWGDEPEDTIEEPVRTKEEEELIFKAEKARKEEEAAKLKEKRRLEEIEKAKEAMQRKKRNAEKAQQRAALKAQKEAEQKEKEREKKARKKERRKAASTDTADNTEQESALSSETLASTEENDQSEKPVEITKTPQKPSQFTRQTKAKSLPLPLRNRGKRRIQSWMWVLIALLVVAALFYMGNNSSLRSLLQSFGF